MKKMIVLAIVCVISVGQLRAIVPTHMSEKLAEHYSATGQTDKAQMQATSNATVALTRAQRAQLGLTVDSMSSFEKPSTLAKIKSIVSNSRESMKKAGNYLLSKEGVKDLVGAYALGMGLTAAHELGHAITARTLYGAKDAPINVTLGTMSMYATPYITLGGIKLSGLNPATGVARCPGMFSPCYDKKKDMAVLIAGPLCGAAGSGVAYKLLKNYPIMKCVAVYGFLNHIIGPAGLGGLAIPRSDAAKLWEHLRS